MWSAFLLYISVQATIELPSTCSAQVTDLACCHGMGIQPFYGRAYAHVNQDVVRLDGCTMQNVRLSLLEHTSLTAGELPSVPSV